MSGHAESSPISVMLDHFVRQPFVVTADTPTTVC